MPGNRPSPSIPLRNGVDQWRCPEGGSSRRPAVGDARRRWVLLGWFLAVFTAITVFSQTPPPQSIRVVMDDNYPPFIFKDNDGNLRGLLVDEWQLWERRTGIRVEIHALAWGEALRRMKAGEFDVIDTVFKTDERAAYLAFSKPYARIEVPIFFDKGISGITDIESLKGFPVAVKAGDAAVDLLRQHGVTTLLLFDNYEDIIAAAKEHKINVFVVDKPPALYFINKLGLANQFRFSEPVNVGEFHRAVKRGNTALLQTVQDGFDRIGPDELRRLADKWQGESIAGGATVRHAEYVAAAAVLLLVVLGGWNWLLTREVTKRTEALNESRAHLRALLDHIPDWVWLKDRQNRYDTANESYARAVQCPLEKLPGRTDADLWPEAEARQFVADDLAVIQSGEPRRLLRKIPGAQGEIRWWETVKAPVRNTEGVIIGTVGIARDVTESRQAETVLRESEERFRRLSDNLPDSMIWQIQCAPDGTRCFLHVSGGIERLNGLSAAAVCRDFSLFYNQIVDGDRALFNRISETGGTSASVLNVNVQMRRPDGGLRWMNLRAAPVRLPGDRVVWDGIETDITEHMRDELALRVLNQTLELEVTARTSDLRAALVRAEAADRVKSAFLATMSHELRTPLNSIIGFTGIILQGLAGPLNEEQARQLGMVRGSARHLLELINDVLDLSKIEAGQMEIRAEPFALREALERVLAMVRPLAEKKGLALALVAPPGLGEIVGDERRLKQILLNLLNNGIKFTDHGGVTLTAEMLSGHRASPAAIPRQAVRLRVTDTGIGIQPADLPKLFQPFRQIDAGTTRQHEGTGLGLAICRRLVALMGGEIGATSEWSKGSEFTVVIPWQNAAIK